jgi:hypothetical protein
VEEEEEGGLVRRRKRRVGESGPSTLRYSTGDLE